MHKGYPKWMKSSDVNTFLTIGLLGKSCLLRESCLGWEGRLLETATKAGGETVGSRCAKACRHAHRRSAKGCGL